MTSADFTSKSTAAADLGDGRVRFFEAISQQIRKPLDGMQAVTDLLRRQPLTPDAQDYVRALDEHYQALLRTLADAADLARADAGALELNPQATELRSLMDDLQDEWAPQVMQSAVALSVSYDGSDITALVDAPRLRQIFNHLIDRALTVTRRGGVEASMRARLEGGRVMVDGFVRDAGATPSCEKLSRLFESGMSGGDAISLALCGRLIQAMDGSIQAECNTGAGVTIRFAFAADQAQAPGAAIEDIAPVTARTAHILVVDDNATNRMVAEALCEMFDCTSESAEDGVEAVEAAKSGRFDLILMDIKMPRMDGIEATRAIRAMTGPKSLVPIIALTANADPEDAMNYLASGMSSVVEKPIKPEALLAAMNACLPGAEEAGTAAAA